MTFPEQPFGGFVPSHSSFFIIPPQLKVHSPFSAPSFWCRFLDQHQLISSSGFSGYSFFIQSLPPTCIHSFQLAAERLWGHPQQLLVHPFQWILHSEGNQKTGTRAVATNAYFDNPFSWPKSRALGRFNKSTDMLHAGGPRILGFRSSHVS